ncbi:MAG: HD domain-containing phosphohydrolase [Elusimicrobiales bacterium]
MDTGAKTGGPRAALKPLEIFNMAASVNAIVDLDALLQKIGDTAETLLNCEAGSIMLLDETRKFLYFRVATGDKGGILKKMTLPVGEGIAGWVAQRGETVVVNDAASDPRFAKQFDKNTGFVTRQLLATPMMFKGEIIGVAEVVNRRDNTPFSDYDVDLFKALSASAAVAVSNTRLIRDHKNFFSHVLELLSATIETTRPGMESHPNHSAYLSCAVGRKLGITDTEYRYLYYAGLLHDIGYVGMKNARLVDGLGLLPNVPEEELHVLMSVQMLEGITILQGALPVIRQHHENFDGSGFPDRLSGNNIVPGARILRLVEAMEELRMTGGLRGDELRVRAIKEARDGAGTLFDPRAAEAFIQLLGESEQIWEI